MSKDPKKLENYLIQLGKKHCSLGIPLQHLDVMGPIFCNYIRPIFHVSLTIE